MTSSRRTPWPRLRLAAPLGGGYTLILIDGEQRITGLVDRFDRARPDILGSHDRRFDALGETA